MPILLAQDEERANLRLPEATGRCRGHVPLFQLKTLGGLALLHEPVREGPVGLQRKHLALLALLSADREAGISRDLVVSLLWPEADTEASRGALKQAVYTIRRQLGLTALTGTNELGLDPAIIGSDSAAFEAAMSNRDFQRATEIYGGAFLDGVHIKGAPEFERWVESRRNGLRQQYRDALEALANAAEKKGLYGESVGWWRRLVVDDPLGARTSAGLINSLAMAGDSPAGLAHYRIYENLVREEFSVAPDPSVTDAVQRIRAGTLQTAAPGENESGATIRSVEPEVHESAAPIPALSNNDFAPLTRSRWKVRWILAGAFIAAAPFVTLALVGRDINRVRDRHLIVVLPFENRTGNDSLANLGIMASDMIMDGLARSGLISVVDPGTVFRAVKDTPGDRNGTTASPEKIALETNASVILLGNYVQSGDSLQFHTRLIDAQNHDVLTAIPPVTVAASSSMKGVELVRERVLAAVARMFDARLSNFLDSLGATPSYEAYRDFAAGMEDFGAGNYEAAANRFDTAYVRDSSFVTALLWSAWAFRNQGQHARALESLDKVSDQRDRLTPLNRFALNALRANYSGDLAGSILAARNAGILAPQSEWPWNEGFWTLQGNRPNTALFLLSRLDPNRGFLKGWKRSYWIQLARAAHATADYELERRTIQHALDDGLGTEYRIYAVRARNFISMGKTREAIEDLDRVLAFPGSGPPDAAAFLLREARIHGMGALGDSILERFTDRYQANVRVGLDEGALSMGEMLYLAGKPAEAERLFAGILKRLPDDATALGHLALLRATRGDTLEAIRLVAAIPKASIGQTFQYGREHYWRARVASTLGKKADAVAHLRQAFAAGYPQLPNAHTHRFEFPALWGYAPFEALVKSRP